MTSLQVCMDSSDWYHQGTSNAAMDSSPITPQSDQEDILTCTGTLLDRRVIRPQHEQALKCPRCESTHTKFCYYNNYSLSQPRYFCKACRRYWTKGGTLRNIPVGGGCRKNKKASSKKSSSNSNDNNQNQQTKCAALSPSPLSSYYNDNVNPTDQIPLAFPDQIHFSSLHPNGIFTTNMNPHHSNFLLENPTPLDPFLENKYETLFGGRDFMGVNGENFGGINDNFGGICYQAGIDNLSAGMQLQYDPNHEADMKPMNTSKILSLEWNNLQQEACNSDAGIGYPGGINGSWTGLMNAFGSSNPLLSNFIRPN